MTVVVPPLTQLETKGATNRSVIFLYTILTVCLVSLQNYFKYFQCPFIMVLPSQSNSAFKIKFKTANSALSLLLVLDLHIHKQQKT